MEGERGRGKRERERERESKSERQAGRQANRKTKMGVRIIRGWGTAKAMEC